MASKAMFISTNQSVGIGMVIFYGTLVYTKKSAMVVNLGMVVFSFYGFLC